MTTPAPGLTWPDYVARCALLGRQPGHQHDMTPVARLASLPSWLTPPLIATEPAREKLRAWATATPREMWDTEPDPAAVLVALNAFGDPNVPHTIARTLCKLPAPVRAYATTAVNYVGVGAVFAGWCGAPPPADRPWTIVVSRQADPAQLETLIAHETGHAWLMPEPAPGERLLRAFTHTTLSDTPIQQVPEDVREQVLALRALEARDEQQVHTLLEAWGYPPGQQS